MKIQFSGLAALAGTMLIEVSISGDRLRLTSGSFGVQEFTKAR